MWNLKLKFPEGSASSQKECQAGPTLRRNSQGGRFLGNDSYLFGGWVRCSTHTWPVGRAPSLPSTGLRIGLFPEGRLCSPPQSAVCEQTLRGTGGGKSDSLRACRDPPRPYLLSVCVWETTLPQGPRLPVTGRLFPAPQAAR